MYNIFRTASNTDLCFRLLPTLFWWLTLAPASNSLWTVSVRPLWAAISRGTLPYCVRVWETSKIVCLSHSQTASTRKSMCHKRDVNKINSVSYIHTVKFLWGFFDTSLDVISINATSPSCLIMETGALSLPVITGHAKGTFDVSSQLDGPQQFYHFWCMLLWFSEPIECYLPSTARNENLQGSYHKL